MSEDSDWYVFLLLVMTEICNSPLTLIASCVAVMVTSAARFGDLEPFGRLFEPFGNQNCVLATFWVTFQNVYLVDLLEAFDVYVSFDILKLF